MFKGKSRFYSIFFNRCPRCHEGKYWKAGPISSLFVHKAKGLEKCSHCELQYEREPGFFYGAMYVGYGLSIAIMVSCWVATLVLAPEAGAGLKIAVILSGIFLFIPYNYWLARLIWLNLFYHYQAPEERSKESKSAFTSQ